MNFRQINIDALVDIIEELRPHNASLSTHQRGLIWDQVETEYNVCIFALRLPIVQC